MKLVTKRLWQAFVYWALQALFCASAWIPLRWLIAFGALLGRFAFSISGRYRRVAYKNLTIAYGETLTPAQKEKITRDVFVNFAKCAMEFPATARLSAAQVRDMVKIDPDVVDELRRLASGNLIAISAHFGNFELMARRFAVEGIKLSVVVRNDNNKAIAGLINKIRSESGYEVLGRGESAKVLLKKVRAGGDVVAMLPDQKSDDLFVPFFGALCGTVAGPAVVALRTRSRVLPIFIVRQPNDTHRIILGEQIDPAPTSDREADIERLMTRITLEIEKVVRAYPEQWLWLHDRWRVKPPAEVAARWEARNKPQTISTAS